MSLPLIIFTKTDRSTLFDNLAVLHLIDAQDRQVIIADYSAPKYSERTRFLVRSQPQYRERKRRTGEIQFLRVEEGEGLTLLKVLRRSNTQRIICFKSHAHFHKALLEGAFLTARNQDLQPAPDYFDELPQANHVFPNAIVMTLEVFWRALDQSAVHKTSTIKTARSLSAS